MKEHAGLHLKVEKVHHEDFQIVHSRLSVLECVDFDGTSYWTVFDPRETMEGLDDERITRQVRCNDFEEVDALVREIVLEAVDEVIEWHRQQATVA